MSTKQSYHESNILTHAKVLRADVLRAALAYAGKGIPVFPCKPGGKSPLTKHGFEDATTDASRITAWWNAHPEANIGIPTGKRSGILALDVDRDRWGFGSLEALEDEHGELPRTKIVQTGGGGMHYYFRYPGGVPNTKDRLGAGLETKSTGTYVVAPPSATTRPYEVLDDAPLADAPEWLLATLRRPHSAPSVPASTGIGTETPRNPGPIGGPIPDGRRNGTLFKYGCALRAQGFEQAAILEELRNTNGKLCKPPLDAGEVEKIASSASRYEPGNASPGPDAETLEVLDGIEDAHLWGRSWKGQGWKTPRSVMVELVKEARKHGVPTKAGVRVSLSVRQLALTARVGLSALSRSNGALDKLKDAGLIRSVKGSGTKSGAFVLLKPKRGSVARSIHSSTESPSPSSVFTQPHPLSAERLRYNKPVSDSVGGVSYRVGTVLRLGKNAENVIDILEREGERMSVAEIGAELGIKNHRDLRRRALPRLEAAGVVECSADGVRLCPDWLAALNRKRQEDQELDDHERDRKKYAEESRIYALKVEARKHERLGMSLEELAGDLKIGTEDVRRLLEIERPVADFVPVADFADGYTEELERVEDFSGIESKPLLTPLVRALRDYLDNHPDDVHQTPYWLGATLWAFDLFPGKPSPDEVRDALVILEPRPTNNLKAVA